MAKPTFDEDKYWLRAAGTSFRTAVFEELFGRPRDGVCKEVQVDMIAEPENKYDENAIRIEIDGFHVGYVNRNDAELYQRHVLKAGGKMSCYAMVIGGYTEPSGKQGHFGLRLAAPDTWRFAPDSLLLSVDMSEDGVDEDLQEVDVDALFD